jgi:uncharacterized membrane protein (UPF0127 family)
MAARGPDRLVLLAALAALCLPAAGVLARQLPERPPRSQPAGEPNRGLAVVPLAITTANGRVHRYRVEVAATPEQQARGMMFRTEMARDSGMIFPMDPPRPAAFWMRNTYVPLDLVFIGKDGRVRNIAPHARPLSEELIPSEGPVAAVLELKGGETERIGLKPGDRVLWSPPGLGAVRQGR